MWSAFCHVRNIKFQIEDGEIFATINQKDGMVEFHDNPEKYNSAHMLLQLNTEVRSLQHCYYQEIFLFMFEIQCVCWVFRSVKKLSFVKIGLGFNQNFSWQYFLFILICNWSWSLFSWHFSKAKTNHCRSDTLKKKMLAMEFIEKTNQPLIVCYITLKIVVCIV